MLVPDATSLLGVERWRAGTFSNLVAAPCLLRPIRGAVVSIGSFPGEQLVKAKFQGGVLLRRGLHKIGRSRTKTRT